MFLILLSRYVLFLWYISRMCFLIVEEIVSFVFFHLLDRDIVNCLFVCLLFIFLLSIYTVIFVCVSFKKYFAEFVHYDVCVTAVMQQPTPQAVTTITVSTTDSEGLLHILNSVLLTASGVRQR